MTVVIRLLSVAAGGALGAVLRYTVTLLTGQQGSGSFPIDTLLVNVFGCFLIGLAIQHVTASPQFGKAWELFLVTGLIGAFTTYSTFGYEFISLLREDAYRSLLFYVGIHIVVGLFFVAAGLWTGANLFTGIDS